MKRYLKSTIAALLAFVMIITVYLPIIAVGQPSSYSSSSNSGKRDVVCTTLNGTSADDYYSGSYEYDVLSEQSSSTILSSLRSLMKSTHDYNSSYDDCKVYASKTDCESNNGKVLLIYTSATSTQSAANSGWNREHVWPKSLGGYETSGAGSDLHHIRPSDNRVNSCRSNLKYGNVSGGKEATGGNGGSGICGGTYNSVYFEPNDNVKGDVARICLYMYVRYGGESQYTCQNITTVFQSVDVLLEWCEMDPVDTWEMGRNEVVEDIQGNRNVFIDYPEYAWLIFGRQVPSDMTTPSGEANEGGSGNQGGTGGSTHTHSYTSSVTTQPTCTTAGVKTYVCSCGNQYTQSISATGHSYTNGTCTKCGVTTGNPEPECTHSSTVIKNQLEANCATGGYTGDTYCADCEELLIYGSQIPSNDQHSYGDWQSGEDGVCKKTCQRCGAFIVMTIDDLIATVDSDAEKILLLLLLGSSDSIVFDTLSK